MNLYDNLSMLEGIKIVDMTSVVFGPYATQILADMGAEVIKIESGIGDTMRYSIKPAKTRAMGPAHLSLNRGKKSAYLDLKTEEDCKVMRNLLKEADIFVHNVRHDPIKRLGFDYEEVKKIKDDIIYVHCVGFGSDGPYGGLPAYDDIIQAATGTTSLLSRVDGDPKQRFFPSLIADKVAGLHGAYATMAAIIHKLRTGRGQFVEVPMFESFAHFMLKEHLGQHSYIPPTGPACYDRQVNPYRQPYPTKDGYIVIVPYTLQSWEPLYEALGAPEVLENERYASLKNRVKNQNELYAGIADKTPQKTTAEWMKILREKGLICTPAIDIEAVVDDPHLRESGLVRQAEHPTEGAFYELAEPGTYSEWSPKDPAPAPLLGEHTDEIKSKYSD